MTAEPSPPPAPPEARGPRIAIAFGILVAVIVIYVLSLIAVHLLAKSAPPLPAVDLSKVEAEDSVVQVRLEKLDTVANRLTVNVLVYPKDSLYDKNFGVLTTDAAVRLYPENNLGDLQYPVGKAPAQVSTTIEAHGDPGNWPFDTYKTEIIAADVFTGTGHRKAGRLGRHRHPRPRPGRFQPGCPGRRHHYPAQGQGPADLRCRYLPGPYRPARVGIVGGHSRGVGQDLVLAADDDVVRRDAVRHRPAAQHPAGQPAVRFVDRPSHRAMGVDSAGRRAGPVPGRLVASAGSTIAEEGLITPSSVAPQH
jgi:hypothetical protein